MLEIAGSKNEHKVSVFDDGEAKLRLIYTSGNKELSLHDVCLPLCQNGMDSPNWRGARAQTALLVAKPKLLAVNPNGKERNVEALWYFG